MNYFKTGFLLAVITAMFMFFGAMLGGQTGMFIALAFAVATNAFAYWNADKMVLRMHGAREVNRAQAPEFYNLVEGLARRADMPMPRVYVIDTDQPNAFATGRNPSNAAVAATRGLLQNLTPEEVAGVMAHELGHVKNYDTLIMTVTATLVGALTMLAYFGRFFGRSNRNGFLFTIAAVILVPLAAGIVRMAISRTREYAADRAGAEISGDPGALASALAKIDRMAHGVPMESAEAHPESGQMFIINPLTGGGMDNLFSTHPNTENRIAALKKMPKTASSRQNFRGQYKS